MSSNVFRSLFGPMCPCHTSPAPNPSVNPDASVHGGNLASCGGGAPVTLIR